MRNEKILIVEDDPLLAADLAAIVATFGYEISGVADCFEAADQLAPFSAIALVDVNLRDGATGPLIGQHLAAEFGIAVVMVTGSPEAIEAGLPAVIGMISKPLQAPLIGRVLDYLENTRNGEQQEPPQGMKLFASK